MRRRLVVDSDNTITDLYTPWIACINRDYGENLSAEDILSWEFHRYTKAGEKAYEYLRGMLKTYKGTVGTPMTSFRPRTKYPHSKRIEMRCTNKSCQQVFFTYKHELRRGVKCPICKGCKRMLGA